MAYPDDRSQLQGEPVTYQPEFSDRPETLDSQGTGARDVASHTADRAKGVATHAADEAAVVKDVTMSAGADVVDSAKQQAGQVLGEAKMASRRLLDEGVTELRSQAGTAQQRVAELVRSLTGELQSMAAGTDQSGPMVDLVAQAERYGERAASWLEQSSPDDLVASVRRYAARNPWSFLAISAGAGLVAARVFRGLQGARADEQDVVGYRPGAAAPTRAYGATGAYGTTGAATTAGYGAEGYGTAAGYGTTGVAGTSPVAPPADPWVEEQR